MEKDLKATIEKYEKGDTEYVIKGNNYTVWTEHLGVVNVKTLAKAKRLATLVAEETVILL